LYTPKIVLGGQMSSHRQFEMTVRHLIIGARFRQST
jgi:hypothetical protein